LDIDLPLVITLIKDKGKKKKTTDNKELIYNEILRCLLTGQKHVQEMIEEVWPKIQVDTGIMKKSFQSTVLKRRLDELEAESEPLIKKTSNLPKNVVYDIYDEKAREKARIRILGSPEELRVFAEFFKVEAAGHLFIQTFNELLSSFFLELFWCKIAEAILNKDLSSLEFYKKEGGRFISSIFGVAVDTFASDEYHDEVELYRGAVQKAMQELENEPWKHIHGPMFIAGQKVALRPHRMDLWLQWVKEKVAAEKESKGIAKGQNGNE
jgi:hypothetical protein